MSQIGRWIGVAFLGGGIALGAGARRAQQEARAAGEARESAAKAVAAADAQRLEAESRATETRATRAAALQPLNAAVDSHVDGATLVDLFEHEDWWLPYRENFVGARVIVADSLLATWGKLDFGTADAAVVHAARERQVASARVKLAGQDYIVVAARLAAMPEREPVLVLARRAAPPPLVAATSPPKPGPLEGPIPLPAAGGLAVVGLALVLFGGGKRRRADEPGTAVAEGPGAAVAAEIPREPTLKFGTPARPMPAPDPNGRVGASGHRPPLSAGAGVSIPGSAGSSNRATVAPRGSAPRSAVDAPAFDPEAIVEAVAHLDSGRTFGRYRLLERLGEGGMSEVFTAVAQGVEGFSRTFVLKRLRPELAREREAVAQFIDEARLQAALVHSNIVPVFDFGMIGNGEYFMTQEYIVGRDLLRIMTKYHERSPGGLEPSLAFYIAHETLQALAFAHEHCDKEGQPINLVHRDVSPGNLMVSLRGEVKLADFGIVKASRRVSRTQVGMVKGNANFMSPEQARGAEVDQRSDLFSLALVLFFCLKGEFLYGGENDLDVLYKAARGPTAEDMIRIATLPEPAASILAKALSFDPADRFQSAPEFADQLAAFIGGGKAQAAALLQLLFGDELRKRASAA